MFKAAFYLLLEKADAPIHRARLPEHWIAVKKGETNMAVKTAETVVLVHGLWMHGWVMKLLGTRLRSCGFRTVCFSYPSMRASLSQNASVLSRFVERIAAPRIHFIGHSLGGLLILQMLAEFPES